MEDKDIVALYWDRSKSAIKETPNKYGKYCFSVAYNILYNQEDADESVNDTYMNTWNSMLPHKTEALSAFLGKITRFICLKKWRDMRAQKRGGGEVMLAYEEIEYSVPDGKDINEALDAKELAITIDDFLSTFLILIEQMNDQKFRGDIVTFTVGQFLSHKSNFKSILSEIDLSKATQTPETLDYVNIREGNISELPNGTVFLKPDPSQYYEPVEGVTITALGYIGGKLHVQVLYDDIVTTDNHGWLSLKGKNGRYLECEFSEAFWDNNECSSYQEYIFDIPHDELNNYELLAEFTTCNQLTEGNWEITFPISDVQQHYE